MSPPRKAGQHARERTRALALRALLLLGGILVTAVVAGLIVGFGSRTFIIFELVAIAAMLALERRFLPVIDRWDRGATGEQEVGKRLEGLRDAGWHVLHDLNFGRGNIDHVLIGPAGVISVETKSHGGRIDVTRLDERMLKQAYAQSKLLSELTGQPASPLLVFSRAYLYPRPVSRQRGVVVLPARMIEGHLARRAEVLSVEDAATIRDRLQAQASAELAPLADEAGT